MRICCAAERYSPTSSSTIDKQNPTRYHGHSARCIALPSLRDVEYEYGEGSSLREVAAGGDTDQPPVFFSFNRFDADQSRRRPMSCSMASFPRLAVHAAGSRSLVEDERGRVFSR